MAINKAKMFVCATNAVPTFACMRQSKQPTMRQTIEDTLWSSQNSDTCKMVFKGEKSKLSAPCGKSFAVNESSC